MTDLTIIQNTFAQHVSRSGAHLNAIQKSRTALLVFYHDALELAKQNKHFSQEQYRKFSHAASSKQTAKQLLQFIYSLALAGGKLKVVS